jgi:peptide/nickel transport system ATP-binding protein
MQDSLTKWARAEKTQGRFPRGLSRREHQHIVIARALAAQPEPIVRDEPPSAFDFSARTQILNLADLLQQHLGLSYLFIIHNLGIVKYFSAQVAVTPVWQNFRHGPAKAVLARSNAPTPARGCAIGIGVTLALLLHWANVSVTAA